MTDPARAQKPVSSKGRSPRRKPGNPRTGTTQKDKKQNNSLQNCCRNRTKMTKKKEKKGKGKGFWGGPLRKKTRRQKKQSPCQKHGVIIPKKREKVHTKDPRHKQTTFV